MFSLEQNTGASDKETNSVEKVYVRGRRICSECFIHLWFLEQLGELTYQ